MSHVLISNLKDSWWNNSTSTQSLLELDSKVLPLVSIVGMGRGLYFSYQALQELQQWLSPSPWLLDIMDLLFYQPPLQITEVIFIENDYLNLWNISFVGSSSFRKRKGLLHPLPPYNRDRRYKRRSKLQRLSSRNSNSEEEILMSIVDKTLKDINEEWSRLYEVNKLDSWNNIVIETYLCIFVRICWINELLL